MKRNYTLQCVIGYAAVTLCIGAILFFALRTSYENEQAQRREIEAEWIAEQKAYEAEVRAEKERWEVIEAINPLETIEEEPIPEAEPEPEIFYDDGILDGVEDAARYWGEIYDIEPEFLEAIAWQESRFSPSAENGGCVGLMQIAPRWHQDRMERLGFTNDDLYTITASMGIAADYLAELRATGNDDYWVLMTYNGDSRADDYLRLEDGPSEYALIIVDLTWELTFAHRDRQSVMWLSE